MEDVFRQLEDAGLHETVLQLKRDIKASKMKKAQIENMADELLKGVRKLNKEEIKKEPFAYPKKAVDRQKVIETKPVNDKVLQKIVNKMIANNNLDEVKTKFHNEDKIFKLKCFKKLAAEKENLFPDMNKIYQIQGDAPKDRDDNLGDSRSYFKPSSLDDPSDTSIKFEHYRNYAYDNSKKGDVSLPISDVMSSIKNQSNIDSFAHPAKYSNDTSKVDESFKRKMNDADIGMSQIYKVDQSFIGNTSKSLVKEIEDQEDAPDEYDDDDDPGFLTYEAGETDFLDRCKEIAETYNYPAASVKPPDETDLKFEKERMKKLEEERRKEDETVNKKSKKKADADKEALKRALGKAEDKESDAESDESIPTQLPKWVKFVPCEDEFYPAEFNGIVYDCYNLKVVFDREKTGFEESREFPIVPNSIIAGRYQVMEYLGSAAFSKAIRCYDLHKGEEVCMKIIENNKDYYDQSIDEIKLLRYININCEDVDNENVIKLIDFFYHKEHLFIVTELLKDNLYEFYKYNREKEDTLYFTLGRLQRITKQILIALDYIHGLHLIHCDLKPENILIKSYSKTMVKVIDFGSSCFIHDHLSSYVQSRSYRAPEVILGCRYDYKIDIWSLGCIVAELFTGYVMFQNDSVQGLLARVLGIIGPIPEYMMKEGKLVSNFFTREGIIYQEGGENDNSSQSMSEPSQNKKKRKNNDGPVKINLLVPKKTTLKNRLKTDDLMFVDFVKSLLQVDPCRRPTAKEALAHPWLTETTYPDDDL